MLVSVSGYGEKFLKLPKKGFSNSFSRIFHRFELNLKAPVICNHANEASGGVLVRMTTQPPALYEPRHDKTNIVTVRPAKTQISLGIRPV